MKRLLLPVLLTSAVATFAAPADAARVVSLPPLTQDSVAGARMGTTVCITANMLSPSNYADVGVTSIVHNYKIALKNLSDTPQDVTISILPGSYVESQNSGGAGNVVPDQNRPRREVGATSSFSVHLPANGQTLEHINVAATDSAYSIDKIDGTSVDCAGTQQVCLKQVSYMIFQISVAQDRGAVVANLSSSAHRCSGSVDHYLQPPVAFQINGGRPF